jgi:hypothetical protein
LYQKSHGIKEYLVNPMHPKEKINFIISGVRDGFKKSHLLCNNNIAEVIDYIDDRRQISNSANEIFYSIEKTANYTLATLFNPNTTDQVGRKAYVAITLFVRNGYAIQGNLIDTLNGLMNYYLLKQGNEISNRFTEEMFEAEYANLSIVQSTNTLTALRKNCGYFNYENTIEINAFFENLTITGFQKVYFLSPTNAGVINQLISFEKITNFPRQIVYQISDFVYGKYDVLVNNESYVVASNTKTINIIAFQGDEVIINNRFTKKKINFTIAANNLNKSIFNYFPEDKPKPIQPHTSNNGGSNNMGGYSKGGKEKKPSIYLISAVVVLSVVLLSIIGYIIWEKYYKKPDPPPTALEPVSSTTTVSETTKTNTVKKDTAANINPAISRDSIVKVPPNPPPPLAPNHAPPAPNKSAINSNKNIVAKEICQDCYDLQAGKNHNPDFKKDLDIHLKTSENIKKNCKLNWNKQKYIGKK